MSWKESLLSLIKKHGATAKFASTTVLSALLPGSAAVVSLVENAFEAAKDSAQDDWEQRLLGATEANSADLERLGGLLAVLEGHLAPLCAQIASLQGLPRDASELIKRALATDEAVRIGLAKLRELTEQFAQLENQGQRLLEGQAKTAEMLAEILHLVRRPEATQQPTSRSVRLTFKGWVFEESPEHEHAGSWGKSAEAPGVVSFAPGLAYRLHIAEEAEDEHLGCLADLEWATGPGELILLGCKGVTDRGMAQLGRLRSIRLLHIHGCDGITEASLPCSAQFVTTTYAPINVLVGR